MVQEKRPQVGEEVYARGFDGVLEIVEVTDLAELVRLKHKREKWITGQIRWENLLGGPVD